MCQVASTTCTLTVIIAAKALPFPFCNLFICLTDLPTRKAALDPSTSTLAKNKEQHEEEHGTVMSDLSPHSTEELANAGQGSDSSHDLRTSIL